MGGRNTVLLDALTWRIPLVSDIPTIIFGADVTHPESGEDSSPSIAAVSELNPVDWNLIFKCILAIITTAAQVVASQDWPEVTKYTGLVCAQPHRQELIQDLFKTWQDPERGMVTGGMIRFVHLRLLLEFCMRLSLVKSHPINALYKWRRYTKL